MPVASQVLGGGDIAGHDSCLPWNKSRSQCMFGAVGESVQILSEYKGGRRLGEIGIDAKRFICCLLSKESQSLPVEGPVLVSPFPTETESKGAFAARRSTLCVWLAAI